MIKAVAISVFSVIIIQLLKQYKPEYSLLIKLASILVIGVVLINELNNDISRLSFLNGIDDYSVSFFPMILKTLGIVIITQIASNICHDSGEEALSTITELVGKIFILLNCLPLIEILYNLIKGYLEA